MSSIDLSEARFGKRSTLFFGLLLIAAAVLAVYGPSLRGYFLADDFGYVSLFANLPLARWPELFVKEWSLGIWGFQLHELRPIPALSFMLDARIWGGHAFGYRLTNLLLHVTCSYLVFVVGVRLLRLEKTVACGAALLFAVHPCHVVPVVWITGRVDVLPPLFCLAGLVAFARFRERGDLAALACSYACYFAAAFSKEYGLVLPLLIAAYDISRPVSAAPASTCKQSWTTRVTPYVGYFVVLGIYYACRRAAFEGGLAAPPRLPPWWHVVGQQTEYWRNLLALERVTGGQLFSWRSNAPVAQLSFLAVGAVGAMTILALLLPRIRRKFAPSTVGLLFCGPIWFLVSTLPFTVTYTSARHLYLASAGLCLFLAVLLGTVFPPQQRKWWFSAGTAVLIFIWGFDAWQHSLLWRDASSIAQSVVSKLRRLEQTPPRTVLVMNVPIDAPGGAYVFAWSSPFLFDRPFLRKSLRKRLIVIENPQAYYTPVRWNQKREIERVVHLSGEIVSYRLEVDPASQSVDLRPLDGGRLQEAARILHAEIQRDPAQDSRALWEQFRSAL